MGSHLDEERLDDHLRRRRHPEITATAPLTVLLKPASGLCNMDCAYCFYKAARAGRENSVMSAAAADALIQKIGAARPSALNVVFQGGEPLLAGLDFLRALVTRLRAAAACPVSFSLQTNGLLIDGAHASFFKENNILVGVSLDGDRTTTDRYRKDTAGNSVFRRVTEAVGHLREYEVDFNILSVVDNENALDIPRTYAYFRSQDYRYLQFIPCLDEGRGVSLSAERYGAFLTELFDLWYGDFENGRYVSVRHIDNYIRMLRGEPPENCAMGGVCGRYYTVEADGAVYPCDFYCAEPYMLGTVFDEAPFAFSEKHRAFIARSHLIHARCRGCEYHFLCRGGCLRDRTPDGASNNYCAAYARFFAASADRLVAAARQSESASRAF